MLAAILTDRAEFDIKIGLYCLILVQLSPSGGSTKRLDKIKLKKYIHFIEGSNKLFFTEN